VKAVLLEVSPAELARRKKTGEDRWDEMWQGVLHLSPAPGYEHQRIIGELIQFLGPLLKRKAAGILVAGINVFRADNDYRIPDLTFVARGREDALAEDGARRGPDLVIEVRSPGDESYDKLAFYAALGVREVIIILRDEKRTELFRLAGDGYVAVASDANGLLTSEVLAVRFGLVASTAPRLLLQDAADAATRVEI
jgi:Uma2 family endonuclease